MILIEKMFDPILVIYKSEIKRKVYLNSFIDLMFDDEVVKKHNELVNSNDVYVDNLLDYYYNSFIYNLNEHDCKVIASFISYLGTNGGYDYLCRAEAFKEIPGCERLRYELAWSVINTRDSYSSHGYRAIEFLLNPAEIHPYNDYYFKGDMYCPTIRDYEVITYTCKWLATVDGQAYLKNCESDIKILLKYKE